MAAGLERERAKNGKGAAGLGVRKKGLGRRGINEGGTSGEWRMANETHR